MAGACPLWAGVLSTERPFCSLCVAFVFPFCSLCVPFVFPLCSLCVPFVFPFCSLSVPFLFPFCSHLLGGREFHKGYRHVTDVYTSRPKGFPFATLRLYESMLTRCACRPWI